MSEMGYIPVALQPEEVKSAFVSAVYRRLILAVGLFIAGQWAMFSSGIAYRWASVVMSTSWLLVLGGFMIVSWLSNRVLWGDSSPMKQWIGFSAIVGANVLIFSPMLVLADIYAPGVVSDAAAYAVAGFLLLSFVAVRSSRDFLWFGAWLRWAGVGAIFVIAFAVLYGLSLGDWFSIGMVSIASASILFETQVMMRQMPVGKETAVAAGLFSSLALLFWYILRLMLFRR